MGRASKLLLILITDPSLMETDEVKDLIAKGHEVVLFEPEDGRGYDLIMGANAWQMTPDLVKYVPLAVKAARDRKYGQPGVKKHDSTRGGKKGSDKDTKREAGDEGATTEEGVE